MATTPPGRFIWYELITPDSAAAAAFYGAVIGWHHSPAPPGAPVPYSHFARSTGGAAGGVMELTPDMIAQHQLLTRVAAGPFGDLVDQWQQVIILASLGSWAGWPRPARASTPVSRSASGRSCR